jgi:glutaconate CoA-transferase subunit A
VYSFFLRWHFKTLKEEDVMKNVEQTEMKRRDIVIDEREAASFIKDGMTISIGGFLLSSHPMTLIRQIVKRGVKNLTVVGPVSATIETDLLIGAGCAKKVVTSYCGVEEYAPICPMFRAFAEQGKIEVYEVDEAHYYNAFKAAALGLPFFPDRAGVGTDFPKVNPAFKYFKDPLKGETLLAIPPIEPDVSLLYAAYADPYGNVQPIGTGFGDRMHWIACKKAFVQVEKIIDNLQVRKFPERTAYHSVDGVVRAPYGSHPFQSPGLYNEDGEHIREYLAAAEAYAKGGDRTKYDAYLKKYVYEPETQADYLERIGIKRLISLHDDVELLKEMAGSD